MRNIRKQEREGGGYSYFGLSQFVMLPTKYAPTKLVRLCASLSAIRYWFANYTAGCCIGVCVGIGVVGCLINLLVAS